MSAQSTVKEKTIFSAMAAAFADIETAIKTSNNPHFKSKYADLTTVIDAIKPGLVKHDLFFIQKPEPTGSGVTIETIVGHAGGETMSLGVLFVPANKNDAQGFGSALTYARRYALVTAFGVPVEDDDGNAAAKASKAQHEAPANVAKITEDQVTYLIKAIPAAKKNSLSFCQYFKIKDVTELPAERYDEAKDLLDKAMAKLAQDESNAKAKQHA